MTLSGTGSDADADANNFHWDAPGVTLNDPDSVSPTGVFPIRVTLATLTVTDEHGAIAVDDVMIAVVDTTPPQVFCTTDVADLWPPNHAMAQVAVFVQATDACTRPQDLILLSVTVSSNEPDDAAGESAVGTTDDTNGHDGYASPVEVGDNLIFNPVAGGFEGTILLRAERDGNGSARAYTIKAWVMGRRAV